jgi:aminopeptidase N
MGERASFVVRYRAANAKVDPTAFGMPADYHIGFDFRDADERHPALAVALSFPTGARHWFPCDDQPDDKATSEILLTVAADLAALANGRLAGVTEDRARGTKTYRWLQERPHSTYLFMAAAGPYQIVRDSYGGVPVDYWVYKKDVGAARRSFGRTPEILAFFSGLYGAYPWAKYDQVTVPSIGGGAEATTATLIGDDTIHDERAEQDFPSDSLVAHEAAHQWWGDLVTLSEWGETWINESFGTYSDYLWTRHARGDDEGAVNLLDKRSAYLREARTRYVRPIVTDRWRVPNDNFDSHTYPKGALVLHMMRSILGDQPFFAALRRFLERHAFGPADTHDLLVAVREATGQNLDWFFDQWLYRAGHPVLRLTRRWEEAAKTLTVRIEQQQEFPGGVQAYRLPVAFAITTAAGTRVERAWVSARDETLRLACPERPLLVRFDPDNILLKEWSADVPVEELLYQLDHDDVTGRLWAAGELAAGKGDVRVGDALAGAARHAAFWAVRRAAIQALAAWRRAGDVPLFQETSRDVHSRVRAASLAALGDFGQASLVPFLRQRFEADDSYLAQAEALRAIGKSGDGGAEEFLRRAAALPSPRNVLRNAANAALASLK